MATYRVHKEENYSVINNEFLKRKDLSWKAKGILAYLLHLPDDWELHFNELKKHATDGKTSLRSGVDELREKGYITYKRYKDKEGKFVHEYDIYELPQTEKPDTENPDTGNPDTDNRDILLSTNELNTNQKDREEAVPYQKIKKLYNNICGNELKSIRKMSNHRREHLRARWREEGSLEVFEELFNRTINSKFLTGNNDRNWKADFDWLIKNDTNFNKVLEDKYDSDKVEEKEQQYEDFIY